MRATKLANCLCLLILVVATLALVYFETEGAQPFGNEVISYTLVSNKITLHEPVIINFTINNVFAEPIMADLGIDLKENFLFTVKQPNGIKGQVRLPRKEGLARFGKITVYPGQSYKQQLLVNEWLDFSLLGKHEITVQLTSPVHSPKGLTITKGTVFHAIIEVISRNHARLKMVSESLLSQVVTSNSYEQAAEATTILGYIKDSAAVPYLEKALKSGKLVEPIAIKGLARIKSNEAVQVLISALNLQNSDIVDLIKATLSQLETEVSDPSVKQQIKRALGR